MRRGRPHPYIERLARLLSEGRIGRRQFLRNLTLLGLSAAAAIGLADRLSGRPGPQATRMQRRRGGLLRVGMRVPDLSRPHSYAWVEPEIARQVVPTLTRTGADCITRPQLLESWEVSDDLRSWTLHLRRDVRWRRGGRLTSEQVAWNLRQVLDESKGSPVLHLMAPYMLDWVDSGTVDAAGDPVRVRGLWDAAAIETPDSHTVRINTRVPQVALPQHLQHGALGILDPVEDGFFGPGSNGTGAFELTEVEPGKRALLRSVDSHWGGGAALATLEFVDLGDDKPAALAALTAGDIDLLPQLDLRDAGALRDTPGIVVHETSSATTAVARMRVDEPPFHDPRVRKAMRLAIDCDAVLAAALDGHGLRAEHHHLCPIQPDYPPLPPLERDVEAARRLLAEAGFADGLKCEILAMDDPGWELAAVEEMQRQWKEAGIHVRIRKVPWSLYWELWNKAPFGFTSWAHESLGSIGLALAYRSDAPWNESGYANPELDRLLAMAEATLELEPRREIMANIGRLMQEDGPIVQPVWSAVFAAHRDRVKGFRLLPSRALYADELAVDG